MQTPQTEFFWSVPEDGFKWSAERDPRSMFIDTPPTVDDADPVLLPQSHATKTYEPLSQHSGMFKQFAETPRTQAAILEFANRYGNLLATDNATNSIAVRAVPPWIDRAAAIDDIAHLDDGADRYTAVRLMTIQVETLHSWIAAIDRLNAAVSMWELLRTNPTRDHLVRAMDWSDSRGPIFPANSESSIRCLLDRCDKSAMSILSARQALSQWISHVPGLTLTVRMSAPRTARDRPRKVVTPSSLLSAMWLQLVDAIDQNKDYRRCALKDCPRVWFEVSTDQHGVRADAKYCSNACKQKAWRQARAVRKSRTSRQRG